MLGKVSRFQKIIKNMFDFLRSSDTCDMNLHTDKFPAYPLNVTINDALNEDCSCEVGTQVCPAKGFYPTPPQIKVSV